MRWRTSPGTSRRDSILKASALPAGVRWMADPSWRCREPSIDPRALDAALADTRAGGVDLPDLPLRLDQRGSHATIVPLRFGLRPVGFLALAGPPLGRQTIDALSGFAALAVERFSLLGNATRQHGRGSGELSDALLASFSHDLRTPLTAIELAATNLKVRLRTSCRAMSRRD